MDELFDLINDRFHVGQDLCVGETQDSVAGKMQLYVPAVIRFELALSSVLWPVHLDNAALLGPQQIHYDRIG